MWRADFENDTFLLWKPEGTHSKFSKFFHLFIFIVKGEMHTGRSLLQQQNALALSSASFSSSKFFQLRQSAVRASSLREQQQHQSNASNSFRANLEEVDPNRVISGSASTGYNSQIICHGCERRFDSSSIRQHRERCCKLQQGGLVTAGNVVDKHRDPFSQRHTPPPNVEDMPAVSQAQLISTKKHIRADAAPSRPVLSAADVATTARSAPVNNTSSRREEVDRLAATTAAAPAVPRSSNSRSPSRSGDPSERIAQAEHALNFAQETEDHGVPAIAAESPHLASCQHCSRRFAIERLGKHQQICLRSIQSEKSRQVVDLRAKRVEAMYAVNHVSADADRLLDKLDQESGSKTSANKKQLWRMQSAQLQHALKSAKGTLSEAEKLENVDDRVPCPHCGRRFAEATAERHIPKCPSKSKGPR